MQSPQSTSLLHDTLRATHTLLAAMVRKLKHHEQKLLKKVDFNTYKSDNEYADPRSVKRRQLGLALTHTQPSRSSRDQTLRYTGPR
jgi:hypothetical protein